MLKKYFVICALACFTLMGGMTSLAMAEMSEQELRILALEEKLNANSVLLDVMRRFTLGGDFRFRFQHTTPPSATANESDIYRIRMRLKGKFHMSKDLDINFRLVTGGKGAGAAENNTSANQTLDNTFAFKEVVFDQAYFAWAPSFGSISTNLVGGKMPNPFHRSELVWDSDVTPEGLSETFTYKIGKTKLQGVFGQFILEQSNGVGQGVELFAFQGVITQKTPIGKFKFSGAYYDYNDAESSSTILDFDNTTGVEVKLANFIGEWSEKVYGHKVKVFAEYVENTGDFKGLAAELNKGWQVGAKLGKSGKKLGDWDLKAIYRVSQRDAVFAGLDDSDFAGGDNTPGSGSGQRGWEVGGGIGLAKGVKLGVTYFANDSERGPSAISKTLQTDLKFKF
jgi:hypothetical protein